MDLFENVFDGTSLYNYLFFNVKTVLEYQSLEELEKNNIDMYNRWSFIAENLYIGDRTFESAEKDAGYLENLYNVHAVKHPEFVKIIAISYARVSNVDGQLKRELKRIANIDENVVLENFMDYLSSVEKNPILCGFNVINCDIPLLIKRFIFKRKDFTCKTLPKILKKSLSNKPWECGVVDVANVWKFNGFYNNNTLMCVSDFLGLKKTVDLLPAEELNTYYWDNIATEPEKTIDFISMQSATQTNLVIQLINNLRTL